ncbi:MAG: cytidine deaminase [Flavobacteriaceae bacterium]|jgi:cytidine deaminase|nr:cytidine deaminase [Flavobacteriaceae bacterium]
MLKKLELPIEIYSDRKELCGEDFNLITKAQEARKLAYAKYSNFKVGAAVLLDNGKIISGNNQENAAFPSGLCAERTAVFYAMANYPLSRIVKLAVVAGKDDNNAEPVSPCGSCRQVLLEYEKNQKTSIELLFSGTKGEVIKFFSCADLLPFSFDEKNLK